MKKIYQQKILYYFLRRKRNASVHHSVIFWEPLLFLELKKISTCVVVYSSLKVIQYRTISRLKNPYLLSPNFSIWYFTFLATLSK